MYDTPTLVMACAGSFLLGVMLTLVIKVLFVGPWLRSLFSGGRVSLMQVIGMRLRGSPVNLLFDAHLALIHSGDPAPMSLVESIYLANKPRIIAADDLIALVREHQLRESSADRMP